MWFLLEFAQTVHGSLPVKRTEGSTDLTFGTRAQRGIQPGRLEPDAIQHPAPNESNEAPKPFTLMP